MKQDFMQAQSEQLGNGVTDGNGFSWPCGYALVIGRQELRISGEETAILRDLARRVRHLAEQKRQEEKKKRWKEHYQLRETEPLLFIDPERAWYEILPASQLRCTGNLARIWEFLLRKEICWQEEIGDDRVCTAVFDVQHVYTNSDFGIESKVEGAGGGGAYHVEGGLKSYDDLEKLKPRKIIIDHEKSERLFDLAHEVFQDILEVHIQNSWWYSFGLSSDAIYLRGFENFLLDFYDDPAGLTGLMKFLSGEALGRLDFLESSGLLSLNNNGSFIGTGGYGWCDELPGEPFDPVRVSPRNMWGYSESQETVSLSPAMFEEFILPWQLPLLERFGLNGYGCCEALDNRIEIIKKKVPRLRKITVSPWSDSVFMAEQTGREYVYCWKMNPSMIATQVIDEEGIRQAVRRAFGAARANGCPVEVLMRDICTLSGKKENALRWVQIMREESLRLYK